MILGNFVSGNVGWHFGELFRCDGESARISLGMYLSVNNQSEKSAFESNRYNGVPALV